MGQRGMLADRIAGCLVLLTGIAAIYEAVRLYPLRMRSLVGDDTLVGLLGIMLIIIGIVLMAARF